MPLAWNSFATPVALDSNTFGYRWNYDMVAKTDSKDGPLVDASRILSPGDG